MATEFVQTVLEDVVNKIVNEQCATVEASRQSNRIPFSDQTNKINVITSKEEDIKPEGVEKQDDQLENENPILEIENQSLKEIINATEELESEGRDSEPKVSLVDDDSIADEKKEASDSKPEVETREIENQSLELESERQISLQVVDATLQDDVKGNDDSIADEKKEASDSKPEVETREIENQSLELESERQISLPVVDATVQDDAKGNDDSIADEKKEASDSKPEVDTREAKQLEDESKRAVEEKQVTEAADSKPEAVDAKESKQLPLEVETATPMVDEMEKAAKRIKQLEQEVVQYQKTEYALSTSIQRLYDRVEAKEQQRLTDLSNLKAKLGDMNRELVEKAQQKIQKHQEASRLLKDCNENMKQQYQELQQKFQTQVDEVAKKAKMIQQLDDKVVSLQLNHTRDREQQVKRIVELENELAEAKTRLVRAEDLDEKQKQWSREKSLLELKVRTLTNKNVALEKEVVDLQNIANDAVAMVEKMNT